MFTLGSMIKNLSEEKSNMIASALAQIPQKVILFIYFFFRDSCFKIHEVHSKSMLVKFGKGIDIVSCNLSEL